MEVQPLDTLRQRVSQQVAGHPIREPGAQGLYKSVSTSEYSGLIRNPQDTLVTIRPHHRIKTMELEKAS